MHPSVTTERLPSVIEDGPGSALNFGKISSPLKHTRDSNHDLKIEVKKNKKEKNKVKKADVKIIKITDEQE